VTAWESAHAQLRDALFRDTLDVALSVADAQHIVACEPPQAAGQMRALLDRGIVVIPQRGADLGERLVHAFEDTFRLGAESVVVIGSDLPDLPARVLEQAFNALDADRSCIVRGPATDGGYYVIGMSRPNRVLFEGIEWGTPKACEQTLSGAASAGIPVVLIEEWQDVDSMEDLDRLNHDTHAHAPRTRAWVRGLRERQRE